MQWRTTNKYPVVVSFLPSKLILECLFVFLWLFCKNNGTKCIIYHHWYKMVHLFNSKRWMEVEWVIHIKKKTDLIKNELKLFSLSKKKENVFRTNFYEECIFLVKLSNLPCNHVKNDTITIAWNKKKKKKYLEAENATGVKIILTETNEEIKHFFAVHKTFFPN